LLDEQHWKEYLAGYPTETLGAIRVALGRKINGLTEKFNPKMRYFGYKVNDSADRAYIYVQRFQLVIDLRISMDWIKEIRRAGFVVCPRNNYQGRAGWLTGWKLPHATLNLKPVVEWLCKAFED